METQRSSRKTWVKPAIQTLNINKDTYTGKGTTRETATGDGNRNKSPRS